MFTFRHLAAISLFCIFVICTPISMAQDNPEERNLESFHRIATEVFGQGNVDVLDEIFAEDIVVHTPNGDANRDGSKAIIGGLYAAMPDLTLTPELILADGDYVAGRFILEGTFENELVTPAGPVPPTGGPIRIAFHSIQHYNEEGQAIEEWIIYDNLNFLTQLGVIPAPADSVPGDEANPPVNEIEVEATDAETEEAHRAALIRIGDESFNPGNFDLLDEMLAEDYMLHSPLGVTDRATSKAIFEGMRAAIPDLSLSREVLVADGNWVGALTVLRGTFENEYVTPNGTLPPTGEPVVLHIVNFFRFDEDGIVVEEWAEFDNLNFLMQLGAIPAPEATAEVTAEAAD
jgi:predicted ester cyclase